VVCTVPELALQRSRRVPLRPTQRERPSMLSPRSSVRRMAACMRYVVWCSMHVHVVIVSCMLTRVCVACGVRWQRSDIICSTPTAARSPSAPAVGTSGRGVLGCSSHPPAHTPRHLHTHARRFQPFSERGTQTRRPSLVMQSVFGHLVTSWSQLCTSRLYVRGGDTAYGGSTTQGMYIPTAHGGSRE
jgi:hypothetical protein